MGSRSLLQGIFATQGSNPGLVHCRRILYQLSYEGSPYQIRETFKLVQAKKNAKLNRMGDPGSNQLCPKEAEPPEYKRVT